MFCAVARVVDGQVYRVRAHFLRRVAACLAAVLLLASPALADPPFDFEAGSIIDVLILIGSSYLR